MLACRPLGSFFWNTYKDYIKSGKNDPSKWGDFSDGDTTLDYLFVLFEKKSLVLDLINPDVGEAGVEGDTPLGEGQGTRQASSTRRKKRRVEGDGPPALNALVSHSADMAASVKRQTDMSELSSLSQTLKNLKEADADPELIASVNARLRHALLAGRPHPQPSSSSVPSEGGGEPASRSL
ncbi:hypothetical protein I4F81_003876 [Pyropia yezoensis]|uniref:Uncharacterized protein n=1 Tax=Pyropia yezoensis TaxID=2788 RepID=A0ACC3BTW4_PYRYE|nr:hypothetical protein I4F81_003876 [Neopyropia yezoensis]